MDQERNGEGDRGNSCPPEIPLYHYPALEPQTERQPEGEYRERGISQQCKRPLDKTGECKHWMGKGYGLCGMVYRHSGCKILRYVFIN